MTWWCSDGCDYNHFYTEVVVPDITVHYTDSNAGVDDRYVRLNDTVGGTLVHYQAPFQITYNGTDVGLPYSDGVNLGNGNNTELRFGGSFTSNLTLTLSPNTTQTFYVSGAKRPALH